MGRLALQLLSLGVANVESLSSVELEKVLLDCISLEVYVRHARDRKALEEDGLSPSEITTEMKAQLEAQERAEAEPLVGLCQRCGEVYDEVFEVDEAQPLTFGLGKGGCSPEYKARIDHALNTDDDPF